MNADNKSHQRRNAYNARAAQSDKDTISRIICQRFMALPDYAHAETVMCYVHCRSEVRTHEVLTQRLKNRQNTVIPYCTQDSAGNPALGLWQLQHLDELQPGTWGILEPPQACWNDLDRAIAPQQLDLIMIPGVAFDTTGGRLGNGAGYYDRLLDQVRSNCVKAAVCYEAQLLPKISMARHDIYMDYIITERAVYRAKDSR